jgi:hypothetical protein
MVFAFAVACYPTLAAKTKTQQGWATRQKYSLLQKYPLFADEKKHLHFALLMTNALRHFGESSIPAEKQRSAARPLFRKDRGKIGTLM